MSAPCFFHVDLDAFFASVEQLDNPEYRGKPVIVGSLPGDRRGVVSTCSYEARKYGVHSAMPIGKAFRLCPSAIFLRGRMKRYHEKSQEVMAVLSEFSPEIRQMSIDEAFMDMSGTERLFGTPEEAAKKLKAQVAERTGLTISIGAASNKYIAKIASGLSKPDGLYIVENGAEEKFMLSLPLKKIWGIGEKTLDRITRAGFNSSRDIHKASLNLLQSLFGSCTGSFLYRAVRGCEVETFDTEAKSRSISSEHTFSFDLTDRYTIDTALLELSWELMYRLLTEGWTSKTVHVKIRYEDFTTVSIQGTSERIISSADDLYGRAKALFDAKYENGRGIRLLGLGAQNLESGDTPVQKELFDFGEKKKAAVEKAVIGIQKKNPAIHIEKARLLHAKEKLQPNKTPAQKIKPKNIPAILLLIAASALTGMRALPAQDRGGFTPKPFSFASRVAVFSLTPDSPEVEFYARGSWEAKLETSFGLNLPLHSSETKGSKNQAPTFTFSPPVFTQKTDLTVWFLLQSKWYFEAAIADNYAKSTVAAGYYGEGFLRHVRVGNRGISFPGSYGIDDIGKGAGAASDQAPGITAHWESPSWQADALLRYDMLESFEKKWSGTNELNEKKIGLAEWQKGARFVLPEGSASLVASVYVESDKGNYKDDRGYVYAKLTSSDYLVLPSSNAIILAKKVSGRILVDFLSSGDGSAEKTEIVNKLGTFSAAGTDGSFLQDIQEWFSPSSQKPPLWKYSYPDPADGTVPLPSPAFEDRFFTGIGKAGAAAKVHALILQYPPFFSPFADSSLYALSSDVQSTQTSVVSASGIEQASYGTIVADENSYGGAFGGTDFFAKRTQYIRLFNRAVDSALQAGVARAAERYPAAKDNPFIYLTPKAPAAQGNTIPSFIAVQTSSVSHVLDIGTEAVPGSIVMYRNGIKDTAFSYDAKTGLVHPLNPPLAFETVRITWQQHKEGARSGRLSAAAGIQKRLTEHLSFDASSSLLWPLAHNNSYSTSSSDAPGSLSAAAKFDWRKNDFSLKNTTALSFEMPDTTGTRRILGMDGSKPQKILLTEKADAEFPEGLVPHLKQRPQPPPQLFPGLDLAHKIAIQSTETVRLADTEGYAVRINWALQNTDDWTARTIDFKGAAGSLASAREFSIRLKMDSASPPANYEIYLQLGANENQLIDGETPLPTWRISEENTAGGDIKKHFNLGDGGWQKVSVYLRDEDRLQLAQSQNARLIIRSTSGSASGTLTVGACEIGSAEFGLSVPEGCLLRSAERSPHLAQSADMLRFNPDGTNSAQFFGWNIPAAGKKVRAYRYTEALALSSYEELVFFIYIEESQKTDFSVKFESESAQGTQTALDFTIKTAGMDAIRSLPQGAGWQKAVFNFNRRTLSVNGTQLSASDFSVEKCDTSLAPNRVEFAFKSDSTATGANPAKGSVYIDEVHVTGSDYRLNFENVFAFDWGKAGTIVSIKGFPLAANPQFTAKIRADVRSGNLKHAAQMPKIGAYADSRIKADIAGMETSVAAVFSAGFPTASSASVFPSGATTANTYNLHSASHSIKTTPVFFITRLLSAGEEYSFAPQAGGAKKTEKAALDFSAVNLPLLFAFKTEGNVSARFLKQEASFESRYSLKKERFEYGIEARLEALQYGQTNRTKISDYSFSDYFSSWLDVSKIQFSAGEQNADKRNIDFTLNQKLLLAENRFEPQIRLNARNAYASSAKTENTASDCTVFSFPFSINRWQFSADWTKKSSSSAPIEKGGSYARDVLTYARFTDKRLWAYVIPVYDFFDAELPKKMKHSGMNLSSYESLWELSWKRPLFVSPWDIVVPSRASFSAARSVQTSSSDTSDTLQFKANFGFTAFNSFGRFGSYRLTDWYEQDEAVSSVTLIYKTDKNDFSNYRLGVSGYNQFMLFFTQSDKLRFSAEYRADTESIWNVKFEALWDRAGKTSIVKDAFVFLFSALIKNGQPKTEAGAGNIRRKNTLTVSVGTNSANRNKILQTYGFRHSAEFDINAYAKASVFFGTEISFYDASFGIKNNAGLSAKIRF